MSFGSPAADYVEPKLDLNRLLAPPPRVNLFSAYGHRPPPCRRNQKRRHSGNRPQLSAPPGKVCRCRNRRRIPGRTIRLPSRNRHRLRRMGRSNFRYQAAVIMFMLIDCDNFFVSCERIFQPKLKTVPLLCFPTTTAASFPAPTKQKRLTFRCVARSSKSKTFSNATTALPSPPTMNFTPIFPAG